MTPQPAPRHEGTVRAALNRLCPRFIPEGPATTTETSLLINGHIGRTPVIAKHPIDPRPFWQQRCRHEIAVYQALATDRPPLRLPTLVAADTHARLLVLSRLPGHPISLDRYPAIPLPPTRLNELLDLLDDLHTWHPRRTGALPSDDNYPAQLAQITNAPVDHDDHALAYAAQRLFAQCGLALAHGDAHPGNVIALPDGSLALIDLEVAAWRPPGFDAAMLWVLLGPNPDTRARIRARLAPDHASQAAFWAAALLICAREITSHRRHAPTRAHHARLPRLEADLRACRDTLHTLVHQS
jgi:hypothetical protein